LLLEILMMNKVQLNSGINRTKAIRLLLPTVSGGLLMIA